ncbi:MAG: T9SS type A sorting domain-containing protein, partial [Mameliella sp.]|nr:T9SS type A sorting domain-containing protein [Phaeodactylibacter sp.]
WDAVPAANAYRLQYRPIGGDPVSLDIPGNVYLADGLPPASTVQWRVRALCDNENSGFVVGPAVALSDPTRIRAAENGFELFPNPTSGSFTLALQNLEERPGMVLIRSAVGQVLYQTATAHSQLKIDLRTLNIPAGVLFITVKQEGQAQATKRLLYNGH